ncbi:antiterminator Q family protein [Providencia stuartii]|uniref:antiterminator Q family protein n=2 Tax=Providencia stuartii TaxID=588 RepID=UPI0023EDA6C1|nr:MULTISPECIES: antiterminator Q family protein [Providencia]MDF4176507.1 antiterminator Q family protein [Providencia thailandensis]WIJ75393.1 antiterminator Q family protein [Providencia thailandensis]CAK6615041.1 Phage antitermination protein Q [Providencia stuartii]CAK6616207.1 Phage antitermination protein Q [Providencia stuartii]CAK6619679.1 Phage antitermination protein Q [Providencia stuartii]
MNYIGEKELTKEQFDWLNGWLELWGAWVHSGRVDMRKINIIYKFMQSVDPSKNLTRPMCNDDDGMLISQVIDSVIAIDKQAYKILISYYVYGASKLSIASYYHNNAKPRKMRTRGGNRLKKPSFGTCRNEVDEKLKACQWLLYEPLRNAMNNRKRVAKIKKISELCY